MARIAGVDLPKEKRLEIALTYIFGIGRTLSKEIVVKAEVNPDTRVKDLTNEEVGKIRNALADYKVEGALRTEISMTPIVNRAEKLFRSRIPQPFSCNPSFSSGR